MTSDASPTPSPRRRGGQKGNLNALKHGFYSHLFRSKELDQLRALSQTGLSDEIEMLRLIIRRVIDRAGEAETFDQLLRYLTTLSMATAQLSRLLRTQRLLVGEVNQIEESLKQVLQELNQEIDFEPPK